MFFILHVNAGNSQSRAQEVNLFHHCSARQPPAASGKVHLAHLMMPEAWSENTHCNKCPPGFQVSPESVGK